jgi:hypothetical protein
MFKGNMKIIVNTLPDQFASHFDNKILPNQTSHLMQ